MQQISHTTEQRSQLSTIAMAPVSPALAKLLHQVQAQIIREAGECAEPVRDRFGALWSPVQYRDFGDRIEIEAENGKDVWRRRRFCPAGWGAPDGVPWHPSYWMFDSERLDQAGRRWGLQDHAAILTTYVVDDFGNLVPVESA